jgi:hypothetical protein
MNWSAIVVWLISLGPAAGPIIEYAKGVLNAHDIKTRWAAIKQFGDAVVPFLESFPLDTLALDVDALQAKEVELSKLCEVEPNALKDFLPIFEMLLPLILAWFNRKK